MIFTTVADDTTYGSGVYNDSNTTYSGIGSSTSQSSGTNSGNSSTSSANSQPSTTTTMQSPSQTSSGSVQATTQNGASVTKSYTGLWIGLIIIAICLIGFIILLVRRRHKRTTISQL